MLTRRLKRHALGGRFAVARREKTDVAARGPRLPMAITPCFITYDLPRAKAEDYVHSIGRTGAPFRFRHFRISFCQRTAARQPRSSREIEALLKKKNGAIRFPVHNHRRPRTALCLRAAPPGKPAGVRAHPGNPRFLRSPRSGAKESAAKRERRARSNPLGQRPHGPWKKQSPPKPAIAFRAAGCAFGRPSALPPKRLRRGRLRRSFPGLAVPPRRNAGESNAVPIGFTAAGTSPRSPPV